VGNEYHITWNSSSKMFLVYSHLNENELNNVQAFDVETLEKTWVAKNKFPAASVFTRDGLQIIEVDSIDNTIKVRDTKQGNVIRDQNKNCDVGQFILPSFDGKTFLMANETGTVGLNVSPNFYVSLFEMNTGECNELFNSDGFLTLFDVNSTGNLIAAGDETVRIWDMLEQKEVCQIKDVRGYGQFAPNQSAVAISLYQKIVFFDTSNCSKIREIVVGDISPGYLRFSPNGQLLAIAEPTIQKSILVMETATGKIVFQLPIPESSTITRFGGSDSLTFSPDGRYLLLAFSTNGNDEFAGKVRLWQIQK